MVCFYWATYKIGVCLIKEMQDIDYITKIVIANLTHILSSFEERKMRKYTILLGKINTIENNLPER